MSKFIEYKVEGKSALSLSFWDVNDWLNYVEPYISLKSKLGKRKSSQIMWAVALVHDPKSPPNQGSMTKEQIKKDIAENFVKQKDFNWDDYSDLIKAFESDCKSETEKLLEEWEHQLKERDKFLKDWKWSSSSIKDKGAAMKDTKKLWDDYLEVRDKVAAERTQGRMRANYQKSGVEKYAGST